jgi:hypothetical protein
VSILTVASGHNRPELVIPIRFGNVRGWTESGAFSPKEFALFMRAIQTKTQVYISEFQGHFRGFQHGFDPFCGHYSGQYPSQSLFGWLNCAQSRWSTVLNRAFSTE